MGSFPNQRDMNKLAKKKFADAPAKVRIIISMTFQADLHDRTAPFWDHHFRQQLQPVRIPGITATTIPPFRPDLQSERKAGASL
jgi:hypothetical protein